MSDERAGVMGWGTAATVSLRSGLVDVACLRIGDRSPERREPVIMDRGGRAHQAALVDEQVVPFQHLRKMV